MLTTQKGSPVGKLFLIDAQETLDKLYEGTLTRKLHLGDIVYCVREFPSIKGCYEYMLLEVRCSETIVASVGEACAFDGVIGEELPHYVDKEKLSSGSPVTAPVYVRVAQFLRALSPEAYAKRLESLLPGAVIYGSDANGAALFGGGCAVVLAMNEKKDPTVTLQVREGGRSKRVRYPLSELQHVKVANDPGMAEDAPRPELSVLGRWLKGTILQLKYPLCQPSVLPGLPSSFSQRHVIVDKPAGRSSEVLLTAFDRFGDSFKARVSLGWLRDAQTLA